jgi:hypothetical protein
VDSDDWIGLHVGGYFEHGVGSMTVSGESIVDVNWLDPGDPYGGLLDIGGGVDIGDYNTVGTFTMDGNAIVKCYHFDCPDAFGTSRMEAHFNLLGGNFYITADNVEWGTFWLGDTGSAQTSTFDVHDGKVTIESSGIEELGPEQFVILINGWIDEGKITAFGGTEPRAELFVGYDPVATETTLQAIATEPNQAWHPDPRPGITSDETVTLSWSPGDNATSHIVYLGTDKTAVENGTAPNTPTGANSLYPGELEYSTHYYWQVTEVGGSHPESPWPGLVWDFRTADYLVVDDFDSYANLEPDVYAVWDDYTVDVDNGMEIWALDTVLVRSKVAKLYL